MNDTNRRIKIVKFTADIVTDMLKTGATTLPGEVECTDGLPENAVFVRATSGAYSESQLIFLWFTCPDWEEIPEDEEFPFIDVTFTRINVTS